jgi:hypothetical protein
MPDKVAKKLAGLRKMDLKAWATTLWLVKRRLIERGASYSVIRVDTDKKLQAKLKKMVTDKTHGTTYHLEEYAFLNADQDDRVFTIDSAETDFQRIQAEIQKGLANEKAKAFGDLLNSWAYVIEVRHDHKAVYGFRKINSLTQAKKVHSLASYIFRDQLLIDVEEEKVFTIDPHIDFFVYDGTVFITSKKGFESALNFRKGMEDNRDVVLEDLKIAGFFSDVEPIRKIVGSNLHLLRKISAIQKSGYYKDKIFIESLVKINAAEKWGLLIKDDKIVVTDENVELVLTLLNNSRLKSLINQEVFDVPVKKKVG